MKNKMLISIVIGLVFASYAKAYVVNTHEAKLNVLAEKLNWDAGAALSHRNRVVLDDRINSKGEYVGLAGEDYTEGHSPELVIENNVVDLGHDIFIRHTSPVPEPGSVILFVLGLLGLGVSRHKLRHV